jgi:protein-S-isoprenylcysteine O-methyltransferase Ste14
MTEDAFFFLLFFVIVFTGLSIRRYYSYKIERTRLRLSLRKRVREMVQAEGRFFSVLYFASNFYAIVLFLLYLLFSSSFVSFQMPFPYWVRWLGVGLGFLSIPFLLWVHYVLDREWSVTLKLQVDHQLITSGPYRRIRHPMYTVLLVYMLSWVLVSASLLFLVYYAVSGFLIVVRIPREERMMLEKFGEEYRVYMRRTGRLLPHFSQETDGKIEGENQRD